MHEREVEVLREAAAEFLSREALPPPIGGLVTVTRTELSDDRTRGTIFISVYPETEEQKAVDFANRSRSRFAEFFKKRVRGIYSPRVEFVVDIGEKNRRRLDELTN